MLKLEQVKKAYKGFQLDCSMELNTGCVTGLIGKNGAGKSTTFKAILGLISCDSGNIEVFGKPVQELTKQDRERIGVVMADSGFSGYLRIRDLLPVMESLYTRFDKTWFVRNCKKFNLPMDKQIKEFSTGMKRKLQVLAALSHDADLLILDEPTAGLDILAREQLLTLLREYMEKEGRAILISSHISADLEGFCDDLYMIDEGEIILHEDTDILLSDYAILKVTKEQFNKLDKAWLLRVAKEKYGYSCLTNQKQYYQENYPDIVIEKGSIDELILMMVRGEEK